MIATMCLKVSPSITALQRQSALPRPCHGMVDTVVRRLVAHGVRTQTALTYGQDRARPALSQEQRQPDKRRLELCTGEIAMGAKEDSELRVRYEALSTQDLLRMTEADPGDYRPEALQLARDILASRGVSQRGDEAIAVLSTAKHERRLEKESASAPLGVGLKVLCFLLPGLPGILVAVVQRAHGRTRRAQEAWACVACGWAARIVLYLILTSV